MGIHVPERVVTNEELSRTLDTTDRWITTRTGIRRRHIAAEGEAASDLGARAALRALEAAGVGPADLDLVIAASLSHDAPFPATASFISGLIGAGGAGAFDVSAACTGFVYALAAGASFISSGWAGRVMVVGADVVSRVLDWSDRGTAVLFGDGAGAVVLEAATGDGSEIIGFDLGNDPEGTDALGIPAGGSRLPASAETVAAGQHHLKMNGREVYRFATRVIEKSAGDILARHGLGVDDIDLFVPHQANIRIIDAAASKLGIPAEKICTNLEEYGNTSCASIPLCLAEAEASGRLERGDLVLMMGVGGGLSWGSCLARW